MTGRPMVASGGQGSQPRNVCIARVGRATCRSTDYRVNGDGHIFSVNRDMSLGRPFQANAPFPTRPTIRDCMPLCGYSRRQRGICSMYEVVLRMRHRTCRRRAHTAAPISRESNSTPHSVSVGTENMPDPPTTTGGGTTHPPMLAESRLTAPLRARARPEMLAPLFAVTLFNARMLPTKLLVVPNVADVPTCQATLHAVAPLVSSTDEPFAVTRLLPVLKTN